MFAKLSTNVERVAAFQKASVARIEQLVKQGEFVVAGAMLYEAVPLFKAYEQGMRKYLEPLKGVPDFPKGFFNQVGWVVKNGGKIAAFLAQPDHLAAARETARVFVARYQVVGDDGNLLEV